MAYFTTLPKTNNPLIDPLLSQGYGGALVETAGTARTIYYTFDPAPAGYQSIGRTGATAMNAQQQALVKQVLIKLATISDVKFVQGERYVSPLHNVPDQYGYVNTANVLPQYDLSFHSYTNGMGTGESLPAISKASDGVSFIGGRVTIQQAALNGPDALFLLLHETGHAMGMKHPGNYSGGFGTPPYLPSAYDNVTKTVMSYNGNSSAVKDYGPLDKSALSYIYGTKGSDVRYVSGNMVIDGGYDDTFDIRTSTRGMIYNGKGGNDLAYGSNFGDSMMGGIGDDRLYGKGGNDTLYGQGGYDLLDGSDGNDMLYGDTADSADILNGANGNDTIYGSGGSDSITGGAGNDWISAGGKGDSIWGGDGDDLIISDAATMNFNDTVYGGNGADQIFGNGGNDLLLGGDLTNSVLDGNDKIDGGAGNDTVNGGYGDDTIIGGVGADSLAGGNGNDSITGGSQNDILIGGEGNDTLIGGTGSDAFYGGNGNDVLFIGDTDSFVSGGAGADTFTFDIAANIPEGGSGNTLTITDFEGAGAAGGDVLHFQNFTSVTTLDGLTTITTANGFAAIGVQGGGSTTFNFVADGQTWNLTVVGTGTINGNDIQWG